MEVRFRLHEEKRNRKLPEAETQTVTEEKQQSLWPGFGHEYRTALLEQLRRRLAPERRHALLCLGQNAPSVAAALQSSCNLLKSPVLSDEQHLPPCHRALLLHPPGGDIQKVTCLIKQVYRELEDLGILLLVYRPGSMTTLPLFEKARKKLAEEEYPYMKVLECLTELGAEVQWEIEHVPVITSKADWLYVVGRNGPPMPNTLSPQEVHRGLQELCNGCLRYIEGEEPVKFEDRLMFIRATKKSASTEFPHISRGTSIPSSLNASRPDIPLKLPLTEEMCRTLDISLQSISTQKRLV
ncbi:uncharacterized protein [Ambystoma mexicanum]|uniref:uncharacterized protein n=1 Tax=Ambystoma mexicanum TaxID=8296 RepID=UPI0037E85D62